MESEIIVPRLDWLIGGSRIGGTYNQYYASVGTDGQTGCMNENLFNYTVFIEKIEDTEYIKAAVYYGTKSFSCRGEDEYELMTFDLDEASLPEIKKWIIEKFNKG